MKRTPKTSHSCLLVSAVIFASSTALAQNTTQLPYAPPTMVAPIIKTVSSSGYVKLPLNNDQDVLVQMPQIRTDNRHLLIDGGRNVRVIGGELRGSGGIQSGDGAGYDGNPGGYGPTKSLFLEGLKIDMAYGLPVVNGYAVDLNLNQVGDALHIGGVAPGSAQAPDIYVQNCNISGAHGANQPHDDAMALSSVSYQGSSAGYTITTSASNNLAVGQLFICGATTNSAFNHTFKVTQVVSPTQVMAVLSSPWYVPAPPGVGTSATGGYLWAQTTSGGKHSDCYQADEGSITNTVRFANVTMSSGYQGFIGGDLPNNGADVGLRSLVMTNVNVKQSNVWPQDDNSIAIYLKSNIGPTSFDNVYVQPRPSPITLSTELIASYNGSSLNPTLSNNGTVASWPTVPQISGQINLSTDGYGANGTDFTLTGTATPGANYVSPGYSSTSPLVLNAISSTPIAAGQPDNSGTHTSTNYLTQLDVDSAGDGHIISLSLSDNSGITGLFVQDGRNVYLASGKTLGHTGITLTVKAYQDDLFGSTNDPVTPNNATNYITRTILITPGKWALPSGSNWNSSNYWIGGVIPNGPGEMATFSDSLSTNATVALDIPVTLGPLTFDNATASYTLSGGGANNSLTLNNSAANATITVLNGTHTIATSIVTGGNNNVDVVVTHTADALTCTNGAIITGTLSVNGLGKLILAGTNKTYSASALTGNGNIQIDAPLTLNIAASTTFSGIISGNSSLAKTGSGSLTLTATQSYSGGTILSGGQLRAIMLPDHSSLVLNTNADLFQLTSAVAPNNFVQLSTLSVTAGRLDLTNHDLLVDSGATAQEHNISSHLLAVLPPTSSAPVFTTGLLSGNAWSRNYGSVQFHNLNVPPDALVLRYTLAGDANLDGCITMDDYLQLDYGYLFGGNNWYQGDFNHDGQVTIADYVLIDHNYRCQNPSASADIITLHAAWFGPAYDQLLAASIPEPASLSIFLLCSAFLLPLGRKDK